MPRWGPARASSVAFDSRQTKGLCQDWVGIESTTHVAAMPLGDRESKGLAFAIVVVVVVVVVIVVVFDIVFVVVVVVVVIVVVIVGRDIVFSVVRDIGETAEFDETRWGSRN